MTRSSLRRLARTAAVGLALLVAGAAPAWARVPRLLNSLDGKHSHFADIFGDEGPLPDPAPLGPDATHSPPTAEEVPLDELAAKLPADAVTARAIVEAVARSEEEWRRSCPVAAVQGLCVTSEAGRSRCVRPAYRPVARQPAARRRALGLATEALRLGRGRWQVGLEAAALSIVELALDRARLLRADAELERSLVPIPADLDFTPVDARLRGAPRAAAKRRLARDIERFTEWFERRSRSVSHLAPYRRAYATRRGLVAVLAAGRVGTWFEQFALSMLAAPAPRNPWAALGLDAAALDALFAENCPDLDTADAVVSKAVTAWQAALAESKRALLLDEMAPFEAALQRLRPVEFQVNSEIVPQAHNASTPILRLASEMELLSL